jgi:multidrug efflux system membrane fusion protein
MVVRVAERGAREVAISVPENRIGELRSAPSLAISLWADRNRTFEGRLREVSASVDATTRTFAARVAFVAPDEQVQLGMTANVLVPSAASAGALVPATSIYHAGSDPAVWVFDPATGKVGLRKVTLGAFREDGAVILSGLADGEIIVAAGVNKLAPGQTVRLLEPGAAPRG